MSLSTTIPEGFAEEMRRIGSLNADSLLQAIDTEPSVAVRLNRRKTLPGESAEEPTALPLYPDMQPVSWNADGYYLPERPVFTLNPLLHAGAFYVQDASSMIHQQVVERISGLLDNRPLSLLDFCAAPGGKTTAMINALPDGSVVVANEYVPARGKILRENLEKWGYPAVITTGSAAADYAELPEIFDIIAVDAPCSGEGMMRKEEEARRQWTPELVKECAALQRDILTDIVGSLRPGGYLIYSTCTFNLEENELNSRFISEQFGLEPVSITDLGLTGIEAASPALLPDVEALRFMPHLTQGEGLYISIFRKPGEFLPYLKNEGLPTTSSTKKQKVKANKGGKAERKSGGELTDAARREILSWFSPEWDIRLEQSGNLITALPSAASAILEILRKHDVRITGAGLPAAEIKGRDIIPDSRVVLSSALQPDAFPRVELSEEDALRYLRRDAITLPEETPKGYVAVCYQATPLGLMKNLGNRANNLFPMPWRIRIEK